MYRLYTLAYLSQSIGNPAYLFPYPALTPKENYERQNCL